MKAREMYARTKRTNEWQKTIWSNSCSYGWRRNNWISTLYKFLVRVNYFFLFFKKTSKSYKGNQTSGVVPRSMIKI